MVVDLQRLSEALARTSPEESLRQDLTRIIRARRGEIEHALETTGSYILRVPDGRRLRLSREPKAAAAQ